MKNKRPSPEIRYATILIGLDPYGWGYEGVNYQVPTQKVVRERVYSGVTTPGYPSVKHLPFNGYSMLCTNTTPSVITTTYNVSYEYPYSQYAYGFVKKTFWADGVDTAAASVHAPDAEAQCIARLADSFNKVQFNAALFFVERQQFIDLVAKTARRLVYAAQALKRLDVVQAANALGVTITSKQKNRMIQRAVARARKLPPPQRPAMYVSTLWLEFQYGWKPLLQDVHGVGELLARRFSEPSAVKTVLASATIKYSIKLPYYTSDGSIANAITLSKISTCKMRVSAISTNECRQALAQTGITNPALLAWEAIPFSFVVDWFLPVGNYLEQMQAYDGFDVVETRRTRFTRGVLDMSFSRSESDKIPLGYYSWAQGGSGTFLSVAYNRDTIGKPGTAPLQFKSPVSLVHAMNALALLRVNFR